MQRVNYGFTFEILYLFKFGISKIKYLHLIYETIDFNLIILFPNRDI